MTHESPTRPSGGPQRCPGSRLVERSALASALAANDQLGPLPESIWWIGDLGAVARPVVAIVGSRRCRAASRKFAYALGRGLAECGVSTSSGLARGVDAAALEGSLRGGGRPLAFLGNGLPSIYPPEHRGLADRIASAGGLVASEFPPGSPPRRAHFPRRNRWISAFACGVVVVEATRRSGSLSTARWAADQGREICAVPGPVEGGENDGCHDLIRDGASIVTSVEDVLMAIGADR